MPLGQTRRSRLVRPLYSIHALARQRDFVGTFDLGGGAYSFRYSPKSAAVLNGKLQLNGQLAIQDPRGKVQSRDGIRAALSSTQGATSGTAPPRPSKIPELDAADESARAAATRLSATENSGPGSFVAVMYFQLERLDGRTFGVPADMSHVQLNVRLYPIDDTARTLHGVYSSLVDALYSARPLPRAADALIKELNTLYGRHSVAAPGSS